MNESFRYEVARVSRVHRCAYRKSAGAAVSGGGPTGAHERLVGESIQVDAIFVAADGAGKHHHGR
jgi:hypothetical protein